jgi:hypothetical protein
MHEYIHFLKKFEFNETASIAIEKFLFWGIALKDFEPVTF